MIKIKIEKKYIYCRKIEMLQCETMFEMVKTFLYSNIKNHGWHKWCDKKHFVMQTDSSDNTQSLHKIISIIIKI